VIVIPPNEFLPIDDDVRDLALGLVPFVDLGHQTPLEDLAVLDLLGHELGGVEGRRHAVEVGSFTGRTTRVLARHFPRVYAIDKWAGDPPLPRDHSPREAWEAFCENIGSALGTVVVPLLGTSRFWAEFWERHWRWRLPGLVFIDGDHSYEAASEDISLWWHRLAPGGCLAVHDYGHLDGVTRACDELLPAGFQHCGRTLAVAWKPE
jgi:hypothetical protein